MPRVKKPKQDYLPASSIPFGGLFFDRLYQEGFIRVKPVGYILTSDLVNDAINRNNVFCVRVSNGNLRIIDGTREVIPHLDEHLIPVAQNG